RNTIIEHHPIGNFARQFHHTHLCSTNVDRYITWFTASVDNIKFNTLHIMKFTMKGYTFHVEQSLHYFNSLAHCFERFFAFNADISCQWIPPGTYSTDDTTWCKVIEC